MKFSYIIAFSFLSFCGFSQNVDGRFVDSVYYSTEVENIKAPPTVEYVGTIPVTQYKMSKDSVMTGYITNLRTRKQDHKPIEPNPISYSQQILDQYSKPYYVSWRQPPNNIWQYSW